MIHYPIPPYKQNTFSNWNNLSFPISEMIHNEIFSLPIGPILTMEEVDFIVEILNWY
jgi:dTDP-4-amino-4,6-dideoxygalactose transaminase